MQLSVVVGIVLHLVDLWVVMNGVSPLCRGRWKVLINGPTAGPWRWCLFPFFPLLLFAVSLCNGLRALPLYFLSFLALTSNTFSPPLYSPMPFLSWLADLARHTSMHALHVVKSCAGMKHCMDVGSLRNMSIFE